MFGNIGFSEFLLIAVIALIVFGPAKLPEIGRSLGRAIREFKQGAQNLLNDEPEQAQRKDVTPSQHEAAPEPPQPVEKPAASASESAPDGDATPPRIAADSRSNPRRLPD